MQKNIVLIHGWGASSDKLLPLAEKLKELGWKVYIPEIPGFGKKPPKKAWNLDDYQTYLLRLSREYFKNNKIFVFGHSFGGRVAIKIAIRSPEVLSGIILCSSGGLSRASVFKRVIFYFAAKLGKIFIINKKVAIFWSKILYSLAREHDYEKSSKIMKDIMKNIISENLQKIISKINLPTLIIWGEKDKTTPIKDANLLAEKINGSKLIVYKNIGHKLPYIKPGEIAEDIDLWSRT